MNKKSNLTVPRSTTPAAPAIRVRGLHKSFGDLEVLGGVDLDVAPGEIVSVIGPSGSGKSTMLRCLIHLEAVTRGTVEIEGEPIARETPDGQQEVIPEHTIRRRCRRLGMVFQGFNLFPHKTALQNVIEGLVVVARLPRAQAVERGERMLNGWAWWTSAMCIPPTFPAAKNSAWPSPVCWPWNLTSCSLTNPPALWTRNWWVKCSKSLRTLRGNA